MSKNYDNWEKLVGAVLRKEQLKQIALSHSRDPSSISDDFSSFNSSSSSLFHYQSCVYIGQTPLFLALDFDITKVGSIQEIFLPTECQKIISRLVHGKRIFLPVEAREFMISSGDFPERQFVYSTQYMHSSFLEVVEVNSVLSLDIRGKIKTRLLTSNTIYGAYLVFEPTRKFGGLDSESAKTMIRFVNDDEINGDDEMRGEIVHERDGEMAVKRADGWMEVLIGSFYIDHEDNREIVEVCLKETSHLKTILIVSGIEFRPLVCVKQV